MSASVRTRAPGVSPRALARAAVGVGILALLVGQVGAEPFLHGIASVSVPAVVAALALTAVATVATAWRWRVLAQRLGLTLGAREAVSAYYRSQFLNSVLPGGIVGDVHRAVSHGLAAGRIPPAARAVVLERTAGQAVQLVLVIAVLVPLGASAYASGAGILLLAATAVCVGVLVVAAVSTRARAAIGREWAILRVALSSVGTIVRVVAASLVAIACHVATFVVACLATGVHASAGELVAPALLAVLAGAIPLSVAGWGPREGVAAWAFAVSGLGASAGIAASTAYGILALVAVAPGATVLAASALRRRGVADGREMLS